MNGLFSFCFVYALQFNAILFYVYHHLDFMDSEKAKWCENVSLQSFKLTKINFVVEENNLQDLSLRSIIWQERKHAPDDLICDELSTASYWVFISYFVQTCHDDSIALQCYSNFTYLYFHPRSQAQINIVALMFSLLLLWGFFNRS